MTKEIPVRRSVWVRIAVAFASVLALATASFAVLQPVQVLPRLQPIPPFSLVDASGQTVKATDLAGSLAVVGFLAASDPTAPKVVRQLREFEQGLPRVGLPVRLVLITVDPERDTPEVLREFARDHGIAPGTWHILTGTVENVKLTVGSGFGVYFAPDPQGGRTPLYDRVLIIVDENGVMRGRYPSTDLEQERLSNHVALLRKESASSGAARVAYEAAHLFMCFPQ